MKTTISMLFVVLLLTVIATAQTSPTPSVPPDIVVLQKNWHLYIRNPALDDDDPFSANAEFKDAQRAQKINDIQNAIRAKGSEERQPPPPRVIKPHDSLPSKPQATYVYRAKIKNTGAKTIRLIDWSYTFLDPDTQQELGRHLYSSKVKIRPGQNDELVGRSATPQTGTVNVKNAGRELSEQVVIYRIEYDDGSVWQNPTQ
jgi:hypothetical protein